MLKELLQQERQYLNHFFDNLDFQSSEEMLNILSECQGTMVFTGVGKSGLVAEKIALTMTSTGSKAIFISPVNALHGDIGIVSEKDVFIMLSKSGESEELLNLVPALRNKKVKTIAIISKTRSRLAQQCDFVILLPMEKELCPFDLVPTTSTAIQMLFGDALAVALMLKKKFTLEDYALNHPSGRIGKRVSMKVKDLMIRGNDIPLCKPEDKLVDVLVELSNKRCGCVLVVNHEQKLQGIFTDGDLRRNLQKKGATALESSMQELMTPTARSIGPQFLAWEAMQQMEADPKRAITVLPVVENDKTVIGLIKLHDIVQSGL